MISDKEAEKISDSLIRVLYGKLKQEPCEVCGAIPVTAAEMNVLRQLLRDNEFRSIGSATTDTPIHRIADVAFPVHPKAAEG